MLNAIPNRLNGIPTPPPDRSASIGNRVQHRRNRVHVPSESAFTFGRNTQHGVTFRWKDYRATGKTRYKTMTLAADEFMRRFLLHVLPGGFHRIRHYGLLANAQRREHLARARELLHVVSGAEPPSSPAPVANVSPTFICPHCGAAMSIIEIFARGQPIRAPPTSRVAA
jgi:hypothetical protein